MFDIRFHVGAHIAAEVRRASVSWSLEIECECVPGPRSEWINSRGVGLPPAHSVPS